jgi:hypothetical protein
MWTPWSYLHQRLDDHNWDYEAVLRKAGVTVEFEQTRDILDYFRGTLSANSYKNPKRLFIGSKNLYVSVVPILTTPCGLLRCILNYISVGSAPLCARN